MTQLVFDAIDPTSGTARLIGNAGATDVTLSVNAKGLHFIEVTGSGNLMVTTVFRTAASHGAPGTFVFVYSRHFALGSAAGDSNATIPSQHHGLCAILE